MTNEERELCVAIARDENFEKGFSDPSSPYKEIAMVQKAYPKKHLPEPWNGHLLKARILFISSNPNIDPNEEFPNKDWEDDRIAEFFDCRFENNKSKPKGRGFWHHILRKGTNWIGECLDPKISVDCSQSWAPLAKHVASTEIVHCKSHGQDGVAKCERDSFDRWMPKILGLFQGEVIVLVGKVAWRYESEIREIKNDVTVVKMYHSGAWGIKDQTRKTFLQNQVLGLPVEEVEIMENCHDANDAFFRAIVDSGLFNYASNNPNSLWIWPKQLEEVCLCDDLQVCIKRINGRYRNRYILRVFARGRKDKCDSVLEAVRREFQKTARLDGRTKNDLSIDVIDITASDEPVDIVELCRKLQGPLDDCGFWGM